MTLAGDLKTSMQFEGYVMSDWGATHSTSIMAGLDIEMPGANYMNSASIKAGIQAGNITVSTPFSYTRGTSTQSFALRQ